MTLKTKLGGLLLIVAYLLLIPGVSLPVLQVTTTLDKAVLTEMGKTSFMESQELPPFMAQMVQGMLDSIEVSGTEVIQDSHKSILDTANVFWQDGNALVAGLIILFSIVIPVLKGGLMAFAGVVDQKKDNARLQKISSSLSKWSMADVFVIALIIVFLGANSSDSGLIETTAELEIGFYFFLGYCLLSIISSQLLASKQ
ncbi:MAG TPA: paraquat-inducible membrane protein A [Thiomicrospira sp.]|nr:paraquat-inducible membrane protein A [Thiomicrospira sp.]